VKGDYGVSLLGETRKNETKNKHAKKSAQAAGSGFNFWAKNAFDNKKRVSWYCQSFQQFFRYFCLSISGIAFGIAGSMREKDVQKTPFDWLF
jgi:hypothetical protein